MKFFLNAQDIDSASLEAEKFLTEKKVAQRDVTRIRLSVEDTLLRYKEQFGEDQHFNLRCKKVGGNIQVSIAIRGQIYDPYSGVEEEDEDNAFMRNAIFSAPYLPQWKYVRGANVYTFEATKKTLPSWFFLCFAIVMAIICSFILKAAPANISDLICGTIISPLMDCFLGLIKAVATPLIGLSVVWGMYSIGDASTFGRIGKRYTKRLLFTFVAVIALTGLIAVLILPLQTGGSQATFNFVPIYELILNIFPTNIVTPFADGNTLQVFFMGIVIGLALLVSSEKTGTVAAVVEELNLIHQRIMSYLGKLIPIFVFGSLLNIFVTNDLTQLASTYKLVIAAFVSCVVYCVIILIVTSMKLKVPVGLIWKKMVPNVIIALSTSASSIALPEVYNSVLNKYGVKNGFANFGIPFAQVVYKPGTTILYMCSAFYIASACNIEISISWFITAWIISCFLGLASPPVAGGTLAAFSVLFAQLNLPIEYLALIFTIGTLMDFFGTASSVLGIQCELLITANDFDFIDRKVLESTEE